ncbi:MAG: radical SAM family heme chaperone HemW [Clostridiales bacterium]|nr:radical SAM family heme chaperone HemW [Clostridiales bacterium]
MNRVPRSAYIHIPFCVRKCAYCDFLSFPDCLGRKDEYVRALLREIELSPSFAKCTAPLTTIYLGGGTPSLLDPEDVSAILSALSKTFGIEKDCEITLEANPGTIDEEKLSAFQKCGVNRLSIGVQSLDDSVLSTLGRIHDAKAAKDAIESAQHAGFTNLSCDMMLGIPGQTLESVKDTLSYFLSRNIPHISLYSLILEEGTPMYARYEGDIEKYVTPEQDREMYHEVVDTLSQNGFFHYEISNMARPGFESRHNMMYWRAEPYFAFGCGAHYYLGNERGRHSDDLSEYIEALKKPDVRRDDVWFSEETISEEDRKKEFMLLRFRMGSGVSEEEFQKEFGVDVASVWGEKLRSELEKGLISHEDGAYFLTEKGFDLANQVFMDYI